MSDSQVVQGDSGPGGRWWLVGLLILIILIIIAAVFFATHPHVFGSGATPTPTVTATAKPVATNTAAVGPTGTPKPGPTGTPASGPTATPNATVSGAAPTAATSASGVQTGVIHHVAATLRQVQQGSNQGNAADTFNVDPFRVVQANLPHYGFKNGSISIDSPPPQPAPSPTSYAGGSGFPQVRIVVKYQGKTYGVFLDQPVQQDPKGIWTIIAIRSCAGTSYCR